MDDGNVPSKGGCPLCGGADYLWFDKGEWVIDFDNGMRGPIVDYCPICGFELPITEDIEKG